LTPALQPPGVSRSSISVLGPTDTEGTINITIANTSLSVSQEQYPAFSSFSEQRVACQITINADAFLDAELTNSQIASFNLVGNSSAVANTSLGAITLDPIKVNVSTSLKGLGGLRGSILIESVDVVNGTADSVTLNINGI
jgi:hypothetical protein